MRNDSDSNKEYDPDTFGDNDADDLSEDTGDQEYSPRRRRKRIKIRKRVRLKRKSDPKKRARKILETIAWTVVIIAFIVTLVILITELDFNEKNRKKRSELHLPEPAIVLSEINPLPLTNPTADCC